MDVTTNLASPGRGVALLAASAAVPGTFARSLSPQYWVDQGLITGLSAGTHYLLTILAHDVLALAGKPSRRCCRSRRICPRSNASRSRSWPPS